MDRPLVEIMLTSTIICIMAITVASSSAQYAELSSTMISVSSEELHYSAVRGIMDAASESKAFNSSVTFVLLLPTKIAISASGGSIETVCLGIARSYCCGVNASGGGFSDSFNITGAPGGDVTIVPNR